MSESKGSIPSRGQVEFSTCPIWFEQYSYEIFHLNYTCTHE